MTERREFKVSLDGERGMRISEHVWVTLRHKVYDDSDHNGLKLHIAGVYRMMWRSWPEGYIAENNELILPPKDVLWKAAKENGTVDNDILGAMEAWCQNYPNTDDPRVYEIAHGVRDQGTLNPDDLYYITGKFLEAHNIGN